MFQLAKVQTCKEERYRRPWIRQSNKNSQELFDIKRKGKGGPTIPTCMRVSVSSPHGHLNRDKFLSSNFVMLSMYGLQLTTTKFLIFVYLDHPFILNTNWSNPSYHIVCYTTRQSSVTNVRLFTQQNTYDQYVYASFFHQHTATMYKKHWQTMLTEERKF